MAATNGKSSAVKPNLATSNNCGGASFPPVENFQAYTSPFGYRPSATGGRVGISPGLGHGCHKLHPQWWTGKVVKFLIKPVAELILSIRSVGTRLPHAGHVETQGGSSYLIDREGGSKLLARPTGERWCLVVSRNDRTQHGPHWGLKYASDYIDPASSPGHVRTKIDKNSGQVHCPQASEFRNPLPPLNS